MCDVLYTGNEHKPGSPALLANSLPSEPPGKLNLLLQFKKIEKNHPSDHKGVNAKEHLWLGRADGPGPVWSGVGGWRRCPVWDWVSQGGGCGMDQTCSGSCSRLWRWRWQRGDPRESGRRKTPETLGGLWASALCGGPGGTVLGGRVPAGVRASRAVGSCFWRCSVFGPGLGQSGRPAL